MSSLDERVITNLLDQVDELREQSSGAPAPDAKGTQASYTPAQCEGESITFEDIGKFPKRAEVGRSGMQELLPSSVVNSHNSTPPPVAPDFAALPIGTQPHGGRLVASALSAQSRISRTCVPCPCGPTVTPIW